MMPKCPVLNMHHG